MREDDDVTERTVAEQAAELARTLRADTRLRAEQPMRHDPVAEEANGFQYAVEVPDGEPIYWVGDRQVSRELFTELSAIVRKAAKAEERQRLRDRLEYLVTWSGTLDDGKRVTRTTILDAPSLFAWARDMAQECPLGDFRIDALADRIPSAWEIVPADSWPDGLPR